MTTTTIVRTINASMADVFNTVADIRNFEQVVADIVRVEFLSEHKTGVGARFAETRLMKGKEATTELEVTEYVENERIRLVADSHGTIWDTVFTVRPDGQRTELTMAMEAKAYKLLPKLINPLIKGMISSAISKDMDAVKAHCEKAASA